ncbi:RlpA-like double-psi beta-barrel-protein domain-containing protein-containing protein [Boletus coccyginus]|nr:RlpA-like double-psi beta-barrel-protein domain-containing protein-containing protein [Boletus coccyginus]
MRSFHLLSLVLSVFLSCSPASQAKHSYEYEQARARHRNTSKLYTFDAKYKRGANAAFTYFNAGQGACGATNGPGDFIVALNSAEYDGGAHCFQMITITINGKTAQAQITDECLGCAFGGLDFSQGLFEYFAPVSEGELYGFWSYNSDIIASSSPPTSSSTPTWTPSSTAPSTTVTTSLTSTVFPSPTLTVPTYTPQDPQMITQINLALLELGGLLQASLRL